MKEGYLASTKSDKLW